MLKICKHSPILTPEREVVCRKCGEVLDPYNEKFDYSPQRIKDYQKITNHKQLELKGGKKVFFSMIEHKDDKDKKYTRIINLHKKIVKSFIKEEIKNSEFFLALSSIFDNVKINRKVYIISKEILRKILNEKKIREKIKIKNKNVLIFVSAIVFKVSRYFDPLITEEDILSIAKQEEKGVSMEYFGESRKYIINSKGDYIEYINNNNSKKTKKKTRIQLLHHYMYLISRYIDFSEYESEKNRYILFSCLEKLEEKKVKLKNGMTISRKDHLSLVRIALSIYNYINYKIHGRPSNKILSSLYVAILIKYGSDSESLKKIIKFSIDVTNKICKILGIIKVNSTTIKLINIKYCNAIGSDTNIIVTKTILQKIVKKEEISVDIPSKSWKNGITIDNIYYVYKSSPFQCISIVKKDGKKTYIKIDDFRNIVNDIVENRLSYNEFHSEKNDLVFKLLLKTNLIKNKDGKVSIKKTRKFFNTSLNFFLGSSNIKYLETTSKKSRTSIIKVRGKIEIDNTEIVLKDIKNKRPIISIKIKNKSNSTHKTHRYDIKMLEMIFTEIEKRNFRIEDLKTNKMLTTIILNLLEKMNIVTRKNKLYECDKSFEQIVNCFHDRFIDILFNN